MTRNERPAQALYLLVETGLILGLAYFTFVGGAFAGIYLYGPRPISQAIVGTVAGAWLAGKFLRKQPWPGTPLDSPLFVALVTVAMATLFAIHPRLSLDSALVIFTYALVFCFLYEQMQAAWFADLLLKCLFIVGSIVCLFASIELLRWYFGFPDGPSWSSLGLGILPPTPPRIGGLSLGSPNHLSGYLALLMPLALARGLAARRRVERLGLCFLGLLMLGLIGVSQSRGGLLGALGGLTALAVGSWPRLGRRWPKLRPTRERVIALVLLLTVAFVGLTAALAWRSRVETAHVRLDMWASALQIVTYRPLLGVGPGCFGLEYLRHRDVTQFSEVFSQAHNIYLHTLATLGIAGALASGWLVYKLITVAWGLWRAEADRGWQWTRLGAMAGLAAFAIHGLFDAFFLEFPAVFQMVIILTTLALCPISPRPTSTRPNRWWLKPAIAAVLSVGGVGIAIWSDAGFAAFDRAVAASRQGDWAATVEALETAVHRDPAYDYYGLQLGLAYGQLAADDSAYLPHAIAAYRSGGIERDHYALNHANLAWLLWEVGERDAALDEMRRAAELEELTPNYGLNLGLMLEEMGQLEAAHVEYARAVARKPGLLELSFWDGGQPAVRRRERLAETAIALSQSQSGDFFTYRLGNYDETIRQLETSLKESPSDPDLWVELGQAWLAAGNPSQALDAAERALTAGAPIRDAFALRAQAHLALGNLDAVAADLRVVHFFSPDYMLGQLAEAQGDFEKAEAFYKAAVDAASSVRAVNYGPWVWKRPPLSTDTLPFLRQPALAESLIEAYLDLGNLYARQGMVSEAREAYEAILVINPNQAEARAGLEALP